jgi:hypothetical protein
MTLLPANTRDDEQIGFADDTEEPLHGLSPLLGLLDGMVGIGSDGMCARKLPDVGQNANMTPELVQDAVFACLVRKFLHQLLTLQPLIVPKDHHLRNWRWRQFLLVCHYRLILPCSFFTGRFFSRSPLVGKFSAFRARSFRCSRCFVITEGVCMTHGFAIPQVFICPSPSVTRKIGCCGPFRLSNIGGTLQDAVTASDQTRLEDDRRSALSFRTRRSCRAHYPA